MDLLKIPRADLRLEVSRLYTLGRKFFGFLGKLMNEVRLTHETESVIRPIIEIHSRNLNELLKKTIFAAPGEKGPRQKKLP